MGFFDRKPSFDPRSRVEPVFNLGGGETVSSGDREGMLSLFGMTPTPSGATVTEHSAMLVSAVYACVSRIAGSIASLPLPVYERHDDHSRSEVFGHDMWWLLNEQPCAAFGAAAFWEFIVSQMLLRGDAIAYMYRGEDPGRAIGIKAIIPVPRGQVTIQRAKMPDGHRGPSKLIYTIHTDEGYFTVDQGDVLHFPNMGFNGLCGMSTIQYGARNAVGTAMAADEFAGKFFAQGAQPQHAVKVPGRMTLEQQEAFRAAWVSKYAGNGPSGIPLILTEGIDVTELSMTAADAQLLESRKWGVIDIARAFGVPPFMIGETEKATSWGSGVEEMGRGYVKFTLKAHLKRIQDELNRKLWPRSMRYFLEFDVDGLLQGDTKAQAEFFTKALGGPGTQGWMTINEVRRSKNLPPVDGGDTLIRAGSAPSQKGNPDADDEPAHAPAGA
jgi:HK97 family phage portal protein